MKFVDVQIHLSCPVYSRKVSEIVDDAKMSKYEGKDQCAGTIFEPTKSDLRIRKRG